MAIVRGDEVHNDGERGAALTGQQWLKPGNDG
jgi:hypothetical protein